MDLIGSHVGDVEILEVIGEGGMGTVYAGFDRRLEREVAIKRVRTDRLDARSRARLLREARMLSQLDHPHVCRFFGYVEGEENDFLLLERLRGTTLKEALDNDHPFDPATRLRLATEVADTLRVAHARGIVHRDLSPANVLLVGGMEKPSVKVLDFGLAKPVDAAPLAEGVSADLPPEGPSGDSVITAVGNITGTPGALSPEQARGEALTTASDMYSFGLLAQYLLTGEPALEPGLRVRQKVYRALSAKTLPVRGLDGESTRLIESLLALEPAERPTASETLERLEHIRGRPRRLARRWAVAGGVLLFFIGVGKYFIDLRAERNRALEARAEAVEAQGRAEQARAEAEKVSEFLVGVFGASAPGRAGPIRTRSPPGRFWTAARSESPMSWPTSPWCKRACGRPWGVSTSGWGSCRTPGGCNRRLLELGVGCSRRTIRMSRPACCATPKWRSAKGGSTRLTR